MVKERQRKKEQTKKKWWIQAYFLTVNRQKRGESRGPERKGLNVSKSRSLLLPQTLCLNSLKFQLAAPGKCAPGFMAIGPFNLCNIVCKVTFWPMGGARGKEWLWGQKNPAAFVLWEV